jgi:hypothetical protein
MVSGTERFIAGPRALAHLRGYDNPNDVFFLASDGVEAAIAEYQSSNVRSRLMIVEYHTPQLASFAYQRVSRYFEALPEVERQQRLLKREGNYIIEAFDLQGSDAMQQVVGQIKYAPSIHWMGKNPFEELRQLEDIPQFPMINWLLATFGFIGLMLLAAAIMGTIIGTSFFFWRRWRLRNLPGFSDAGGMMRLNLDQLVLPPPRDASRRKLPGEIVKRKA